MTVVLELDDAEASVLQDVLEDYKQLESKPQLSEVNRSYIAPLCAIARRLAALRSTPERSETHA